MTTILFFSTLIVGGLSHGRLLFPKTRYAVINGVGAYENSPVSGADGTDFACRNEPPTNGVYPAENTFYAGQEMTVKWGLSALHVGDCSLYISYDWDLTGENKRTMEFFKIAQWESCKDLSDQDLTITLPEYVPEGRVVFRWEWIALHVYPTLEFYTQCADARIINPSNPYYYMPEDIPAYPIVGLYPLDSSNGEFRNPWGGSSAPYFVTGTPCACISSQLNGCPIMEDPTKLGYISAYQIGPCEGYGPPMTPRPSTERLLTDPPTVSVSQPVNTPSPTNPPTVTVTQPGNTPSPTNPPTTTVTQPNDGSCPDLCATCTNWGGIGCTDWCSKWGYCGNDDAYIIEGTDCRGCGNSPVPAPVEDPTSPPAPTPAPIANPTNPSCASGNNLDQRSGYLVKRMKTECECQEKCAEDSNNAIYAYLADKEHCFCISA